MSAFNVSLSGLAFVVALMLVGPGPASAQPNVPALDRTSVGVEQVYYRYRRGYGYRRYGYGYGHGYRPYYRPYGYGYGRPYYGYGYGRPYYGYGGYLPYWRPGINLWFGF
jgi:hypothetical protein